MIIALRLLAIAALLLAWFVAGYGAYVRLNDAGLDCPDWPGCYGQVTPPETAAEIAQAESEFVRPVDSEGGWKEMIHRYAAGILGLLILAILVVSMVARADRKALLAQPRRQDLPPLVTPLLLVILTLIQVYLGYLTVSEGVHPFIVTGHLTFGMLLIGVLVCFSLQIFNRPAKTPLVAYQQDVSVGSNYANKKGSWPLFTGVVLVLALLVPQIILGGWTSTNYTAAYCTDFPGCRTGDAWPAMDMQEAFWINPPSLPARGDWEGGAMSAPARQAIHMSHRILAGVVTVAILLLIIAIKVAAWQRRRRSNGFLGSSSGSSPGLSRANAITWLLFAVLVGQLSLGIVTALEAKLAMPVNLAALHNTGAALLLSTLLWLGYSLVPRTFSSDAISE